MCFGGRVDERKADQNDYKIDDDVPQQSWVGISVQFEEYTLPISTHCLLRLNLELF